MCGKLGDSLPELVRVYYRSSLMLRLLLLLFVVASLTAQDRKPDSSTAKYLHSIASPSGGYRGQAQPDTPLTLSATSAGVRSEKYLYGEISNRDAHATFVKNCFIESEGGFAPKPKDKADVASTAIGLMAAAELGINSKELLSKSVEFLAKNAKTFEERRIAAAGFEAANQYPEVTDAWIADLRKTANPDGTYGDGPTKGRSTGGAIAFILRLDGKLTPEERKAAISTLQTAQQKDGAFIGADGKTTDLEATYRIMRAFYLLKEKPKHLDVLKAYLGKCQNPDGGFGRKPGDASSVSGTYYYASISKWIKAMESWK